MTFIWNSTAQFCNARSNFDKCNYIRCLRAEFSAKHIKAPLSFITRSRMEYDFGSWQSPHIPHSHLYRGTFPWTPPTAIYRPYTVQWTVSNTKLHWSTPLCTGRYDGLYFFQNVFSSHSSQQQHVLHLYHPCPHYISVQEWRWMGFLEGKRTNDLEGEPEWPPFSTVTEIIQTCIVPDCTWITLKYIAGTSQIWNNSNWKWGWRWRSMTCMFTTSPQYYPQCMFVANYLQGHGQLTPIFNNRVSHDARFFLYEFAKSYHDQKLNFTYRQTQPTKIPLGPLRVKG